MAVATTCVCALVIGFVGGFLMARRCGGCWGGSLGPPVAATLGGLINNPDVDNPYHVPYLNQ